MLRFLLSAAAVLLCVSPGLARGPKSNQAAPKFAQLDAQLPTPSAERLATGAPGPAYWQQQVDYRIEATLDDTKQRITGQAQITYHNRSPHGLDYLWLQLDQNRFTRGSASQQIERAPKMDKFGYTELRRALALETFSGGFEITRVATPRGPLPHTIVGTMMRVDLDTPIAPGQRFVFDVRWAYPIINANTIWGRGGYETLDADGTRVYTVAQWYPRLAVYSAATGWQNKAFLGRGEFALEFGDFDVALTVPSDVVVAATGALSNPRAVLSATQRARLAQARKSHKKPVFIVTADEAAAARKAGVDRKASPGTKTWRFKAQNVRDFAWAASRGYLWDAMAVRIEGKPDPLAMSLYPKEAEPLWRPYSTHAVAHTLEVYSRMTVPYPYPTAISVNGPVGGMEYPMISFNGPRAEPDGTYYDKWGKTKPWNRSKYGLISVIIHEVGHNWFPMIINSDERQWSWLDEGLNTFLEFVAEQEWEANYPSWRGWPDTIVPYMKGAGQVPIMTNSESVLQFGSNAYAKPATALNILRETVMGRKHFDHAFRTYARRWAFRRPAPADFFRSMEDASGIDLDWFWRGWFYGTGYVDQAMGAVHTYRLETGDPEVDNPVAQKKRDHDRAEGLTWQRNQGQALRVDRFPELKDFYNSYDALDVTEAAKKSFKEAVEALEPWERALLKTERFFTIVTFQNKGEVVMPIVARITYADGKKEVQRYPAELWAKNDREVRKFYMTQQPITRIELDPNHEIADADRHNNQWPAEAVKGTFKLWKKPKKPSPMKAAQDAKKAAAEAAKKATEAHCDTKDAAANCHAPSPDAKAPGAPTAPTSAAAPQAPAPGAK
jgi:hypothetical protein